MIPRDFEQVQRSPQAFLVLTIKVIFANIDGTFPYLVIYSKMKVEDLFLYDPTSDTLQRIPGNDIDRQFRRGANKIFRSVI